MEHIDYLKSLHACDEAIVWVSGYDTLQAAWEACERGDWMLWLIGQTIDCADEAQLRKLTLAKARCAKLVIDKMTDERSHNAVLVAEKFGMGEASRQELDAAADAAALAAHADAAHAASAAYADAAYAASAAYAAAYAAAHKATLKQCAAEIIRPLYPSAPATK